MNITKEQADKVIAALAYAKSRILSEFDDSCIVTAYNIMRGLAEDAEPVAKCWCSTCRPITINDMRMVVCPDCGNKRCPKATDHRFVCTNSNDPGQAGSSYTSPQAAQTEAALCEMVRLSEDAGLYDSDFQAGRAGSKP